jgi:hypothetical protein
MKGRGLMTGVHSDKDCQEGCSASKPCPVAKLATGLNRRLDEIKAKPLGAKHLEWVKKTVSMAQKNNTCMWNMARIHISFLRRQARSEAEKEILNLIRQPEIRKKILTLLDLRP